MPTQAPADATHVVVDHLSRNVTEHVGTFMERNQAVPFIRVERFGGSPVSFAPLWLDAALIQVECFHETQIEAAELGNRVRALMADLPGASPLAVVSRVEQGQHRTETRGDRAPHAHRTLTDYQIFLHPNPA